MFFRIDFDFRTIGFEGLFDALHVGFLFVTQCLGKCIDRFDTHYDKCSMIERTDRRDLPSQCRSSTGFAAWTNERRIVTAMA